MTERRLTVFCLFLWLSAAGGYQTYMLTEPVLWEEMTQDTPNKNGPKPEFTVYCGGMPGSGGFVNYLRQKFPN